ncbi:hypothetical protein Taro_009939, partial [Colocasia esculenta]|nr:hypothetical protein [Colocasia esculenta]
RRRGEARRLADVAQAPGKASALAQEEGDAAGEGSAQGGGGCGRDVREKAGQGDRWQVRGADGSTEADQAHCRERAGEAGAGEAGRVRGCCRLCDAGAVVGWRGSADASFYHCPSDCALERPSLTPTTPSSSSKPDADRTLFVVQAGRRCDHPRPSTPSATIVIIQARRRDHPRSVRDDSKSETWFVDALNSATLGGGLNSMDSASSSVNCLLGLDDSKPSSDGTVNGGDGEEGGGMRPDSENEMAFPRQDSSGKLGGSNMRRGQDAHSAPKSLMLEASSSFGSASSARPTPTYRRSVSSPQLFQQQRYQQQQKQQQQQRPNLQDLAFIGDATSRAMYYQEGLPPGSDLKQEVPQYDPSCRLPVQLTEKGYVLQQQPPLPPPVQTSDLLLYLPHPHVDWISFFSFLDRLTIASVLLSSCCPGCSSIGGGAFTELGPFFPRGDGRGLQINTKSWNKASSLLYVESPAGVGWSYSNRTSDYKSGDESTGPPLIFRALVYIHGMYATGTSSLKMFWHMKGLTKVKLYVFSLFVALE